MVERRKGGEGKGRDGTKNKSRGMRAEGKKKMSEGRERRARKRKGKRRERSYVQGKKEMGKVPAVK